MPSQEKIDKVKKLRKWFEDAESLLIIHYKGLKVSEANELRDIIAGHGVEIRVVKNTLTRIALEGTERENLVSYIDGPVAVVFARGDVSGVARSIKDFAGGRDGIYFQGGLVSDGLVTGEQLNTLASLPPREILIARVVGQIASPLAGLAGICSGPIRKMLAIFSAVAQKKEAQAPALEAAPVEEPTAVEEPPAAEEEAPTEEEHAVEPPLEAEAELEAVEEPAGEESGEEETAKEDGAEEQTPGEGDSPAE